MNLAGKLVLVTGGSGFVGRALVPMLRGWGANVIAPTRAEWDLERPELPEVLRGAKPDVVIHLAAFYGGAYFVSAHADEVYERNQKINASALAYLTRDAPQAVAVLAGSACSYPDRPGALTEDLALVGEPHPSVQRFAETKRDLVRWALEHPARAAMPVFTTLYGPGERTDPTRSHFLGGIIARMSAAQRDDDATFSLWGGGNAVRDVLYVEDAARAIVWLLDRDLRGLYNVASGQARTVREFAVEVARVLDYNGALVAGHAELVAQPAKIISIEKLLATSWVPISTLSEGIVRCLKHRQEHDA